MTFLAFDLVPLVEVNGVAAAVVEELFEIVGAAIEFAGSDLVVRLERFLKGLSVRSLEGCTMG